MSRNYIGSVRFYKNLILLLVVAAIAVSTGLAIHYSRRCAAAENALQSHTSDDTVAVFGQAGDNGPAYQSLYPDFYAPKPYGASQRQSGVIYLTFEDGPSEQTDKVLAVLQAQNEKATFFVSGAQADTPEYDRRLQAIVDGGHTLGMYSWCDDYLTIYRSVEDYLADMYALFSRIRDVTGVTPTLFRFPGGSINAYNTAIYQQLIAEMIRRGFVPCDWNISCGDSGSVELRPEELRENVLRNLSALDRAVIQMRDSQGKAATVSALPDIIAALREDGFRFAALTPETKPVVFSYLT